jgi:hypothetical protein
VINSDHKNANFVVYVQGDLNESIMLRETSFSMKSSEEERILAFDIQFPESLLPGPHQAEVVVLQLPDSSSSKGIGASAALAVATQVDVYVSYPGKYVESEMKVSGGDTNKKIVIALLGRGKQKVEHAYADIEIYDSKGNLVKTLKTNEVSVSEYERKEVYADWEANVSSGKYVARAVLHYDDASDILEANFEVGELLLDLQQISVKNFHLGEIAKFDMIVQNKWSEMISDAYAELRVFDSSMNEIGDMKSAAYSIPSGMQTTMNLYWDTKDIVEGLYKANVVLNYAEKKTQQDLQLDVKPNSIDVIGLGYVISSATTSSGNKGLIIIIVSLVILIILINVSWFLFLRKRFKK